MIDLRHMARGCWSFVRLDLLVAAQYRASILTWSFVSILEGLVYLAVWQSVASASGGTTNGFDERDLAGYFLVMILLRSIVATSMAFHLPGLVRTGKLATHLMRPLHPLLQVYGNDLGFTIQALIIKLPLVLLLVAAFQPRIEPSIGALAATIVLLPLAVLVNGLFMSLIACSSMWLVRIDGIRGTALLVVFLLSGQFAPLAMLPSWLEAIARVLPFYWALGYPAELLVGRADLADAGLAFAVLAAWCCALLALLQPTWRAGTRAFEAVGS